MVSPDCRTDFSDHGMLHAGGCYRRFTGWLCASLRTSEPMWGFDRQLFFSLSLYQEVGSTYRLR